MRGLAGSPGVVWAVSLADSAEQPGNFLFYCLKLIAYRVMIPPDKLMIVGDILLCGQNLATFV